MPCKQRAERQHAPAIEALHQAHRRRLQQHDHDAVDRQQPAVGRRRDAVVAQSIGSVELPCAPTIMTRSCATTKIMNGAIAQRHAQIGSRARGDVALGMGLGHAQEHDDAERQRRRRVGRRTAA